MIQGYCRCTVGRIPSVLSGGEPTYHMPILEATFAFFSSQLLWTFRLNHHNHKKSWLHSAISKVSRLNFSSLLCSIFRTWSFLDNLLQVSPAAYRLFGLRRLEIFERILSTGTTHKYSCALIRIVAWFRCKTIPGFIHKDFQDFVRFHTTSLRYVDWDSYDDDPSQDGYYACSKIQWPSLVWPLNISVVVLRELLLQNRKFCASLSAVLTITWIASDLSSRWIL